MTKDRLHEIIFEADTKKGKLFDIISVNCNSYFSIWCNSQ